MIGLGVITCDRPDFFKQCYDSIPKDVVDTLVVVNDGREKVETNGETIIQNNPARQGVGKTKSNALQALYDAGCEHIFIIEDDIIIKDPAVFQKYIDTSKETGIKHLMFGYHGPANKGGRSHGIPLPKYVFKYHKETLALNEHCVGAFCYYHRDCITDVGYMDADYYNAFEHIDHSYMLAKAGYTTPYWNWADVFESWKYLDEIACSEENSSIRGNPEWSDTIQKGYAHFMKKHNYTPFAQGCVPDKSREEIEKILMDIYEKHSNRN